MSEMQHDSEGASAPSGGASEVGSEAAATPSSLGSVGSVAGGGSQAAGPPSAGSGGSTEGAEATARVCQVALEEFEGPLDLLLHLVRRHELDILDIPIAFVCEKYLEYIEFMRALDLEVAGDYLVMAATLAYLKSRELVPQQAEEIEEDAEEDGPDPRQQLIARLLEYQKFKDAAYKLDSRPIAGRDTFARGQQVELPPVDAGLAPITLFRLAEAYQRVLERARIHKSHEVVLETISVAARMEQLTSVLVERSRFEFEALFLEREWSSEAELRSMLVVTLMSILELVRMGIASVHQPLDSKVILVERVASEDEAREALADYDESISFGKGKHPEGEPSGQESADAEESVAAEAEESAGAEESVAAEVEESAEAVESVEAEESSADVEGTPEAEHVDETMAEADPSPSPESIIEVDAIGAEITVEAEVGAEAWESSVVDEAVEVETDSSVSLDIEAEAVSPSPDPRLGSMEPGEALDSDPVGEPDVVEQAAESAEAAGSIDPSIGPSIDSGAQATEVGDSPADVDAGAVARSVVSESPPHGAQVVVGTQSDGEEHGENGEAQASEGTQGGPGSTDP